MDLRSLASFCYMKTYKKEIIIKINTNSSVEKVFVFDICTETGISVDSLFYMVSICLHT